MSKRDKLLRSDPLALDQYPTPWRLEHQLFDAVIIASNNVKVCTVDNYCLGELIVAAVNGREIFTGYVEAAINTLQCITSGAVDIPTTQVPKVPEPEKPAEPEPAPRTTTASSHAYKYTVVKNSEWMIQFLEKDNAFGIHQMVRHDTATSSSSPIPMLVGSIPRDKVPPYAFNRLGFYSMTINSSIKNNYIASADLGTDKLVDILNVLKWNPTPVTRS